MVCLGFYRDGWLPNRSILVQRTSSKQRQTRSHEIGETMTPPNEKRFSEEDLKTAARLWCLPQHSNKVMDDEFAKSIAQALSEAREEGFKEGHEVGHRRGLKEKK